MSDRLENSFTRNIRIESIDANEVEDRTLNGVDITTCEQLFNFLREHLGSQELRRYNRILVEFAELVLDDPEPYGDGEYAYVCRSPRSFLGHAVRRTGETVETVKYSSLLMELAGSSYAEQNAMEEPFELACSRAVEISGLKAAGFFKFVRRKDHRYLVGTEKLKSKFGFTVRIRLRAPTWDF